MIFFGQAQKAFSTDAILLLKSALRVGCKEHENVFSIGMDFATVNGVVQVNQRSYVDNLQLLHMPAACAMWRDAPVKETGNMGAIKVLSSLLAVQENQMPVSSPLDMLD